MTSPESDSDGLPPVLSCDDLDVAVDQRTDDGYRLVAIGPADEPTWAEMVRDGERLILDAAPGDGAARYLDQLVIPPTVPSLVVNHETDTGWGAGRAGMAYRDLIPDRWGGAYIASHINVKRGGPVPDYVHHHNVAHQLIFVHRGWVRVVYEDQGPAFVMEAGDCVLQPPGIRHQVLEASDELYVTEVTCPADHRTSVDHDLALPNDVVDPARIFGHGQHFVRHIGSEEPWAAIANSPMNAQITGIGAATDSLAELRFLRVDEGTTLGGSDVAWSLNHDLDMLFIFVISGSADLVDLASGEGSDQQIDRTTGGAFVEQIDRLSEGSSVAVPPGRDLQLTDLSEDLCLLELKCRRPEPTASQLR